MSNLRSKPIEGHVTDSAGNVLRNAAVVIKLATPVSGSIAVSTVKTDDDGYFKSDPLPSGTYDVYESGINVSRVIHIACPSTIPCFKPSDFNYPTSQESNFLQLAESGNLNNFKSFLQIEYEELDVSSLGSSYPIYDKDITYESDGELFSLASFFQLSGDSRITTTRFDIEYFSPLTAVTKTYKRIRWAGVPAIRFYKDSKLILPIDYLSLVPSLPRDIFEFSTGLITIDYQDEETLKITPAGGYPGFETLTQNVFVGDVVKFTNHDGTYAYGIVKDISNESEEAIIFDKLKSSRFTSTYIEESDAEFVASIKIFDGMFQGISSINDGVNEKFSVVENVYVQDNETELYNYNNVIAPPPEPS